MSSDSPVGSSRPAAYDLSGRALDGRYRLLRKLGSGGMGTVYLAEHTALETRVAVKVLRSDLAADERHRRRFLREARAASAIKSDRVVRITDFGMTGDGHVYFVMEYVDGEDLESLLRREGPMPWPRAKSVLTEIAEALAAAHAEGIVHRDVKPSNCMVYEDYGVPGLRVKVLDFGLAKVVRDDARSMDLTATSELFGTVAYMAPELTQGKPADARSDIYSFGVLMYRMLTGAVPFRGETAFQVLTHHVSSLPPPPRGVVADIPLAVEACILRALEKDPAARWADCISIAHALDAASEPATTIVPTPMPATPLAASSMPAAPIAMSPAAASASHSDRLVVTEHVGASTERLSMAAPPSERIDVPGRASSRALAIGLAVVVGCATVIAGAMAMFAGEDRERTPAAVAATPPAERSDPPKPDPVPSGSSATPLEAFDPVPTTPQPPEPEPEVMIPDEPDEAPPPSTPKPSTKPRPSPTKPTATKPAPPKPAAPSIATDAKIQSSLESKLASRCRGDGPAGSLRVKTAIGSDGRVLSVTIVGGTPGQRGCAKALAKQPQYREGSARVLELEVTL